VHGEVCYEASLKEWYGVLLWTRFACIRTGTGGEEWDVYLLISETLFSVCIEFRRTATVQKPSALTLYRRLAGDCWDTRPHSTLKVNKRFGGNMLPPSSRSSNSTKIPSLKQLNGSDTFIFTGGVQCVISQRTALLR
jgi:hypothetical protein